VSTTLDIRGLRPSHGWGGTIAPGGIAPEGVPNCNCISMLPAGPRRRPGSHEAYTHAHASLGPPQWTWQSLAALRNKFSACHVLPVRRKLYFTEQQSFLAIGAARHNTLLQSSNWSTEAVAHSPSPGRHPNARGFSLKRQVTALSHLSDQDNRRTAAQARQAQHLANPNWSYPADQAAAANVRVGSCVTSYAGPHGAA
jgi:hypothetical protein